MKRFLLIATLFAITISTTAFTPPPGNPAIDHSVKLEKYQAVQQVYLSQVGVRELTGHNDGVQVEKYLKSVGLTKGYPWCAAFVRWTFDRAGVTTTINGAAASTHNPKHLIYAARRFIEEPRPGDVATLWFPSMNRIAHTLFYDHRINSSVYRSVEGNTNSQSSRDGDGVYIRYRSFNATHSISRWT